MPVTPENFLRFGNARLDGDYIFLGNGSLQAPQIGDLRISYRAVTSGTVVTLFGKLAGETVEAYYHKGTPPLYRIMEGPRQTALAQMATEYRTNAWLVRMVGLLLMFVLVLSYGMWLGLEIDCGCFGLGNSHQPKTALIIDIGLLLACAVLYTCTRREGEASQSLVS